MSTYFAQQNTGKLNLSLDLKRPEAVDIVRRLAARCDVVVENFRGGVMDRLGIGPAELRAINPALIVASITGYGTTGPWRHRRAYASVVNAETGLTGLQAAAHDRPPDNDPHSHADVYTGMETAAAILAALFQRERTGHGQHVDVSMAQTMLYVNEHVQDELFDRPVPEGRIRSFRPGDYPVLHSRDGRDVIVSGHPAERGTFDLFVAAMGRPELLEDPRFADAPVRLAHLPDILAVLREWAAGLDADELERVLSDSGLAMGVLRTIPEIAATGWAAERGVIAEVDDRAGGRIRIPNSPWRFSGSDTSVRGTPRFRGEDNAAVLREMLGMDDAAIAALHDGGVLSARPPRN
jgi:crotonobetainyl-CoA:carnitine CoA-transferase CaiB-like acyl-CoA transferase